MFTNAALTVAVGDSVRVVGRVTEFRPGGTGGTNNLTITELITPTFTILSSGNTVPAPTIVGLGRPGAADERDRRRHVGRHRGRADGLRPGERRDRLLREPRGHDRPGQQRRTSSVRRTDFGEFVCAARQRLLGDRSAHASRRDPLPLRATANPERLIGRRRDPARPDRAAAVEGHGRRERRRPHHVADRRPARLQLRATSRSRRPRRRRRRRATCARRRPSRASVELAVATFNVENLDPGDPAAKFGRLAGQIVNNLRRPT